MALEPDGDFAVLADADAGWLAPDKGPPRTSGYGTDGRAVLDAGLGWGGVGRGAEFAVDFLLVGVGQELVEQVVGPAKFEDMVGGQERGQAFLPVVVTAFDFAFSLGRWGIEQVDAVAVEGWPQLGEGVGVVGVEEGVVVDIKRQGQAVGLEDPGQEIEVSQEGFARVKACPGVVAGGVVQEVEQALRVGVSWPPGVGAGVILPAGAVVAGLPAFDGFGAGFVAGVRGEVVMAGPAADAGAVGLEVEAAMEFTGGGAVGGRRLGGEEFSKPCGDGGRPAGVVIAAGEGGRPKVGPALGISPQVVGAQTVEVAQMNLELLSASPARKLAGANLFEDVPDKRCRATMRQLWFFMDASLADPSR